MHHVERKEKYYEVLITFHPVRCLNKYMCTKNYAGNVWRVTQNVNIDRKINSRYRISKHLAISSSLSGRRLTNTTTYIIKYILYVYRSIFTIFLKDFLFLFLLLNLRLFFYFMEVLIFCTSVIITNSFEVHFLLVIKSKFLYSLWPGRWLNTWMNET